MASLWGDEFTVPSTKEQAKKVIKKAEGKTVQQLLKSKTIELEEKLKIINENVQKVLHVYEKDTLLIRDKQTLADYISAAIKNGIIAIDTETNNSLDPLTCKLMGPCIYTPGEKNVYIPINHVNRKTGYLLPDQLTEEDIKEQFDRLNEANVRVIAHNSSFDYQVLKCTTGYEMNTYWDTLTGSMILDENERSHRLKDQYRTKIDPSVEKYSIDHLFNDVEYKYVDPEIFALYAATDPYITYKLYEYQKEQFEKPGNEKIYHVFRDIDMPVNVIAAEMELRGCCIDEDYAERLSKKYHKLLDQAEKSIYDEIDKLKDQVDEWRLTPEANYKPPKTKGDGLGKSKSEKLSWPVAISSPTQLSILLYDVLKVPPVDKDNPRGTGADILEKIDLPVCKTIVKQRGLAKLIDTFIDKMLEIRSPRDNRVHGHFNVNGTNTGRFSSSEPNLQNIPSHSKDIRPMFCASPGYMLVGADFSQAEPRLLAAYSGDTKMIDAYKNKQDLYATVASTVYNNNYEDNLEFYPDGTINYEGKERRTSCKSIILGK